MFDSPTETKKLFYTVCKGFTLSDLQDSVIEFLNVGYYPVGSIVPVYEGGWVAFYIQAMRKQVQINASVSKMLFPIS